MGGDTDVAARRMGFGIFYGVEPVPEPGPHRHRQQGQSKLLDDAGRRLLQ